MLTPTRSLGSSSESIPRGKKVKQPTLPPPLPWGEVIHVNEGHLHPPSDGSQKRFLKKKKKKKPYHAEAVDNLHLGMETCSILTKGSSSSSSTPSSAETPYHSKSLPFSFSNPYLDSWSERGMIPRLSWKAGSPPSPPLFSTALQYRAFPIHHPPSFSSSEKEQLDLRSAIHRLFPKALERFPELYVLAVEEPFERALDDERMMDEGDAHQALPMPWTIKYSPEKAGHVLGNESRAAKMTRWLQYLRLRPPPRKGTSGQGFALGKNSPQANYSASMDFTLEHAVDEDGMEGVEPLHSEEEGEEDTSDFEHPSTGSSRMKRNGGRQRRDDYLRSKRVRSSLMLLVGPSGSGKTAAAYACAQECGYDVAEVGPETRRTVKDLEREVGGLTKSHIVYGDELMDESGTEGKRQVLILLEQADILFREDVGVWTWLKSVAQTTMRPIIVTCEGE